MTEILSDDDILSNVLNKSRLTQAAAKKRRRTRQLIDWKAPGFAAKARVLTSFGQLPVEALRRNDPVKTANGNFLKVAWVDKFGLDAEFMSVQPSAQPMLIPGGSFGPTRPETDVLLSPAQLLHIGPSVGSGAIKPASELAGWGRISRKNHTSFTYFVFGFERDCTVCVEGLWCEIPARQH